MVSGISSPLVPCLPKMALEAGASIFVWPPDIGTCPRSDMPKPAVDFVVQVHGRAHGILTGAHATAPGSDLRQAPHLRCWFLATRIARAARCRSRSLTRRSSSAPEERFVRRASAELRPGYQGVVVVEVFGDEPLKRREGVDCMQVDPPMSKLMP